MPDRYSIIVESRFRDPLEELAKTLGFTWGDRGNVKDMIQAIAEGKTTVGGTMALSPEQQEAIGQAAIVAYQRGAWEDALLLGDVFSSFQNVDPEFHGYMLGMLEPLKAKWIPDLLNCVNHKQTFRLQYKDAADRPFKFSVCGAQLTAHEKRVYLDCWCRETESNQDIPELQHNWCLRLDRIVNAEIIEMEEEWRSLNTVEAEFRLSGGLAYAYERRSDDTSIQWQEEVKIVRREITNSFWFTREILRYGQNCEVIGTQELRDRIIREIQGLQQNYEL